MRAGTLDVVVTPPTSSSPRWTASTAPRRSGRSTGRAFIRTFDAADVRVFGDRDANEGPTAYLVQETLYPDRRLVHRGWWGKGTVPCDERAEQPRCRGAF